MPSQRFTPALTIGKHPPSPAATARLLARAHLPLTIRLLLCVETPPRQVLRCPLFTGRLRIPQLKLEEEEEEEQEEEEERGSRLSTRILQECPRRVHRHQTSRHRDSPRIYLTGITLPQIRGNVHFRRWTHLQGLVVA